MRHDRDELAKPPGAVIEQPRSVSQGKRDIYELAARTPLEQAAPDLLAALKDMVAYFAVDIEGFDESEEKFLAFQRGRAAIRKAEGQT